MSRSFVIPQHLEGYRLREAVKALLHKPVSRRQISRLLARRHLLLNQQPAQSDTQVRMGDIIDLLRPLTSKQPVYSSSIPVLYENFHLLALDKPAGWLTSGNTFRTAENTLDWQPDPDVGILSRPRPLHRLDAPTSGVLLFAKTHSMQAHISQCLADRKVRKKYKAIVQGFVEREGQMRVALDGKEAITFWEVDERIPSIRFGYISVLSIRTETGRTHQIRRHFSQLGFPLIGDKRYNPSSKYPNKGLFLHAQEVVLPMLGKGDRLQIESAVPLKFSTFCQREELQWRRWHQQRD